MDAPAQEAHAEMIITVTRPDGSTQSAKFVSVPEPVIEEIKEN
jgi:hypothetical protein